MEHDELAGNVNGNGVIDITKALSGLRADATYRIKRIDGAIPTDQIEVALRTIRGLSAPGADVVDAEFISSDDFSME